MSIGNSNLSDLKKIRPNVAMIIIQVIIITSLFQRIPIFSTLHTHARAQQKERDAGVQNHILKGLGNPWMKQL